jgi:hypothetical protein
MVTDVTDNHASITVTQYLLGGDCQLIDEVIIALNCQQVITVLLISICS